jgi:hypothetical protein
LLYSLKINDAVERLKRATEWQLTEFSAFLDQGRVAKKFDKRPILPASPSSLFSIVYIPHFSRVWIMCVPLRRVWASPAGAAFPALLALCRVNATVQCRRLEN